MATPRVSTRLPIYDPSKSNLAYGDRALPKLNRELQSSELAVRQQALLLLDDVMHKRENLASALREGLAVTLKCLLEDEDGVVRERSAKVLGIMAQHSLGRQAFLDLDMITALSKLFSDKEYEVRYAAHKAVEMCARIKEGASETVAAGLVPLCVEKLIEEEATEIREVITHTLHWCFQVDTTQGIYCNTIQKCTEILKHKSNCLRGQAARIIFDLTLPFEGKEIACNCGCISLLVGLLGDIDSFVRAQSAAALMSIAVITKGKYAILESSALGKLVPLLSDINSEVRLNAIKALTLLAEAPKAKVELQACLPKLEELISDDSSEMVVKAATTANRVITWKP